MMCPKCAENTLDDFGMVEGVHVEFCGKCKGIWFDEGELAFYTEMPADVPNLQNAMAAGSQTALPCPKCDGQTLVEVNYLPGQHPLLDLCPGCRGVFVDAGELPVIESLTTKVRGAEVIGHVAVALEKRGYQILGVGKK